MRCSRGHHADPLQSHNDVSRVPTSVRLAELRRRHENHRFAIKQRILKAHAYELILNGGADRLAVFYKGGIKPAQLAQLIFKTRRN